ncbi:MAG: Stf0 family sulfotransferase [Oceanipulchritudo sp.]
MTFLPGCENTIMICALPRSGSNLLCEALGSTKRLGNPDEWLNQDRFHWNCSRFGLSPDVSIEGMIQALQRETRTLNGVFAHKILMYSYTWLIGELQALPQNRGLSEPDLLEKYFPGLRLLHIRRKDRLGQAISLVKAIQSEIWHFNNRKRGEAGPIHFSWTEIRAMLDDLEEQERNWKQVLDSLGKPCLEILFEDLVQNRTETVNRVIDFLGIDCPAYAPETGKPVHRPTRDSTNRRWRERFEEIGEKVRSAGKGLHRSRKLRSAEISCGTSVLETVSDEVFRLEVLVTNTSPCRWEDHGRKDGSGWIKVAVQVVDEKGGVISDPASWRELPHPVAPGETITIDFQKKAPAEPGNYTAWVDCLVTPNRWFHYHLKTGVKIPLKVRQSEKGVFVSEYLGGKTTQLARQLYHSDWLGYFHLMDFPTLYHRGLGSLNCSGPGAREDRFIFESGHFGVLHTTSREFPVLWSEREQAYLKWHEGTSAPPKLSIRREDRWVPYNFKEREEIAREAGAYFGVEIDEAGRADIPWFGLLDASAFPKIQHESLGVLWCSGPGAKEDSFFFRRPGLGWHWTSSKMFPKLRRMREQDWIEADELTSSVF